MKKEEPITIVFADNKEEMKGYNISANIKLLDTLTPEELGPRIIFLAKEFKKEREQNNEKLNPSPN